MKPARQPGAHRVAIAATAALLTVVYCVMAVLHLERVNIDIDKHDQNAYLEYARSMSTTDYAFLGKRNRMPAFPFLASLLYQEGLSDEDFFVRVKRMNVALSLVVLALVFGLLRRRLPPLEAVTLFLIVAFTVFIYRAAYAQAELLFYGLFFWAFLLFAAQLRSPGWRGALAAGAVAGLAHLTKALVLPLLAAFVFWALLGGLGFLRGGSADAGERSGGRTALAVRGLSCGIALAAFFAVMTPYMQNSREHYGSCLFNVNSAYYVWLDSWSQVKAMQREHGEPKHWRDLSPDQIPGPLHYLRTHSLGDIASRTTEGIHRPIVKSLFKPFGYGKYLVLYSIVLLVLVRRHGRGLRGLLDESGSTLTAAFAASSVLGFVLLFCFYSPIASGSRLILAVYLPAMYSIFWLLSRPSIRNELLLRRGELEVRLPHLHLAVLLLLLLNLVFDLPRTITKVYAGA